MNIRAMPGNSRTPKKRLFYEISEFDRGAPQLLLFSDDAYSAAKPTGGFAGLRLHLAMLD